MAIVSKIIITLIKLYRLCISPLLGNCCRFHPSCSCYATQAIATYGCGKGAYLALKRLLRCHPWCAGGIDPIP